MSVDRSDLDLPGKAAFLLFVAVILWDPQRGSFIVELSVRDRLPTVTFCAIVLLQILGGWTLDVVTVDVPGRLNARDWLYVTVALALALVGVALLAAGWPSRSVVAHFALAVLISGFLLVPGPRPLGGVAD